MNKPIIYGFGPFGDQLLNPSQRLVGQLIGIHDYTGEVLPTSYARAAERVGEVALFQTTNLAVIFGYSAKVKRFRLDTIAQNCSTSKQPDIDGKVLAGPINKSLPERLQTGINAVGIALELQKYGTLADVSDSPSGYVCNHIYFTALANQLHRGAQPNTLLVHIPSHRERANLGDALNLLGILEALPDNRFSIVQAISE